MKINHTTKTITVEPWEIPMAMNYLEHCVANHERKQWKVTREKKSQVTTIKH